MSDSEGSAQAAAWLASRLPHGPPRVAFVLGSGLSVLTDAVDKAVTYDAAAIPGMVAPRVSGHAGKVIAGLFEGAAVVMFAGRLHLYEGYAATEVAAQVRVAAALGCHSIVLTNAAGGLAPGLQVGQLVVISDHLNLVGDNPLRGSASFVDMTACYDEKLRARALAVAASLGLCAAPGVYAAVLGPSYETPAEVRMLRVLGADVVGMSTVPEAIAARALGLRVLAISAVTNVHGAGPLSHAEVLTSGARAAEGLCALLRDLMPELNRAA